MPFTTSYLSIGSNIGDRAANLRACIDRLTRVGTLTQVSSFYETEPMEFRDQPWFLNCVVELQTKLRAEELLNRIQAIEKAMGRTREIDKGPRVIDIDILLFGSLVTTTGSLQVPHPAMHQRRFVLEPLAEIAPKARHPSLGNTIQDLLARLPRDAGVVRRLATR